MNRLTLTAFVIGFVLLSRDLAPADETNIIPPAVKSSAVVLTNMPDNSKSADRALPEAPPGQAPKGAGGKEIEEAPGADLRDPFWPIGFVPSGDDGGSDLTQLTTVGPADIAAMFRIGGIINKSGKFYATINGFTVQTGEVVTAVANGQVYRFRVVDMDLKKIKLKPVQ